MRIVVRMRVSVRVKFSAAHRLPAHPGLCRNLHGHNYTAWVDFDDTMQVSGMVVDFDEAQRAIGGWIAQHWDHALLHQATDPVAAAVIAAFPEQRAFAFRAPPTAEVMALELRIAAMAWLEELKAAVPIRVLSSVRVSEVRIRETDDFTAAAPG